MRVDDVLHNYFVHYKTSTTFIKQHSWLFSGSAIMKAQITGNKFSLFMKQINFCIFGKKYCNICWNRQERFLGWIPRNSVWYVIYFVMYRYGVSTQMKIYWFCKPYVIPIEYYIKCITINKHTSEKWFQNQYWQIETQPSYLMLNMSLTFIQ